MTVPIWILNAVILVMDALIRYRFFSRAMGSRYHPLVTYLSILAFEVLYAKLNLMLHIATNVTGNMLYFCVGHVLLYMVLFHGSLLKKFFWEILIQGSIAGLSYTLLPMTFLSSKDVIYAFLIMACICLFFSFFLFEYIGRRLENLRNDLPRGLTLCLLFVTTFVLITTITITELSMAVSDYFAFVPLAFFCCILAFSGTLIIVFVIFTTDKEISNRLTQQSYTMQIAHLKEKEEYWKRLAAFRHDMKNHMVCLDGLLRGGKYEQVLSYFDNLVDTVEGIGNEISTGNAFVDAIVNEKTAVMKAKGIAFHEEMSLPRKCRIEPLDLCCILSNTLDNAIEASQELVQEKRWIKMHSFVRQSQLVIVIENNIAVGEQESKNASRPEREARGIGLLNVRRVVEKYGGTMEISASEVFVFSAMLPLE